MSWRFWLDATSNTSMWCNSSPSSAPIARSRWIRKPTCSATVVNVTSMVPGGCAAYAARSSATSSTTLSDMLNRFDLGFIAEKRDSGAEALCEVADVDGDVVMQVQVFRHQARDHLEQRGRVVARDALQHRRSVPLPGQLEVGCEGFGQFGSRPDLSPRARFTARYKTAVLRALDDCGVGHVAQPTLVTSKFQAPCSRCTRCTDFLS